MKSGATILPDIGARDFAEIAVAPREVHERDAACRRREGPGAASIFPGRHTEVPREQARKAAQVAEAQRQADLRGGFVASQQHLPRPVEARPRAAPQWGFTEQRAELDDEVRGRQAGLLRQLRNLR